jgi:hypothetical protein
VETACAQASQYATVPLPPAVTHAVASLLGAFPALLVALIGWRTSRKDWGAQIEHLQEENEKLTESLRLALYAKAGT